MEHCSRNRIQAAADSGNILVNGTPAKASYEVKPLDRISIVMPYPRRDTEIEPQDIPLDILYEDDDVILVNKAAGMVVHPGHGNWGGTLVHAPRMAPARRCRCSRRERTRGPGPPHRQRHLGHPRGGQERDGPCLPRAPILRTHTTYRRHAVALVWGRFRRGRGDHHGQHRTLAPRAAEDVRLRGRIGRQARRDSLAGAAALRAT